MILFLSNLPLSIPFIKSQCLSTFFILFNLNFNTNGVFNIINLFICNISLFTYLFFDGFFDSLNFVTSEMNNPLLQNLSSFRKSFHDLTFVSTASSL